MASLMIGAPYQSVGYRSPNGWTDSDLFVKWLEHLASFTNASVDVPQIVILDGHHSHKTLGAVEYARSRGITLITLPPHCTHKMQPLDRSYFKSLKSAYNAAADSWMVANPGRRITAYDMAAIFGKAFLRSATTDKAVAGFRTCGLWPYDADIFTDEDYVASAVTDEDALPPTIGSSTALPPIAGSSTALPPTASSSTALSPTAGSSTALPPTHELVSDLIEELSPKPKLSRPRPRSRVAESAAVLTSSPYKCKLVDQGSAKGKAKPKGKSRGTNNKNKDAVKEPKRRRVSTSSEEEDWPCVICGEPFVNSRSREIARQDCDVSYVQTASLVMTER